MWSAAAGTAAFGSSIQAVWVLSIGGVLIHPVELLICRLPGARGAHAPASSAAASTFWLISSLPLAVGLSVHNVAWFFPAMLLIIGGRYLVFATLFGMRLYWALGPTLASAGFMSGWLHALVTLGALAGAVLEAGFAVTCLIQHRSWMSQQFARADDPKGAT